MTMTKEEAVPGTRYQVPDTMTMTMTKEEKVPGTRYHDLDQIRSNTRHQIPGILLDYSMGPPTRTTYYMIIVWASLRTLSWNHSCSSLSITIGYRNTYQDLVWRSSPSMIQSFLASLRNSGPDFLLIKLFLTESRAYAAVLVSYACNEEGPPR